MSEERIRSLDAQYEPNIAGFVVAAAVIGYCVGWPIRWYVEYLTTGRDPAVWFNGWHRYAWQYAAGIALAYPVLWWRFAQMRRKAFSLSDEQWARWVKGAHFRRRVAGAAGVVGWPFIESVYEWITVGGFGWVAVQTVLLGLALVMIDWDVVLYEWPRRALAAVSTSYND